MIKKRKIENPYSLNQQEIFTKLNSSEQGLSSKQFQIHKAKFGINEITEKKKHPYLKALLNQFKSIFIYILILAAVISFFIKNTLDVYIILSIIVINTTIGFLQEKKAEHAIQSLKKRVVSYAKVYRDNSLIKINSKDLVPGDIILLEQGDKIPADARLLYVKNLKVNESALTGESLAIEKSIKPLDKNTQLADRKNMIFLGTFVSSGTAKAIVVATGDYTEIGQIAKTIQKIKQKKTHFEEKINKLSIKMTIIAITGALIIFIIGFFIRNIHFTEMFLFSIAALVSGIPEGLPAVLTIVLAIGSLRMAKKNAITRNLPSVETLGIVDTIISDKTGTITKNIMTVRKILLPSGDEIEITGKDWHNKGEFLIKNEKISPIKNKALYKLLNLASLCSSAKLQSNKDSIEIIGDPTEAALSVVSEKANIDQKLLNNKYRIIDELPFNQSLRFKAKLIQEKSSKSKELAVIGAPEQILEKCSHVYINGTKRLISSSIKKQISNQTQELAKQGMRIIAVAFKPTSIKETILTDNQIKKLTFLGLTAINDPPRPEVKEAIIKARNAGIRVIMATGDHKETAIAIAKEIGLIPSNTNEKENLALTESELEKMPYNQFKLAINQINIFSRLTPKMKLKIALELQKQGHKIAMTGDGVNDAPALKQADIGISMGLIGTDVARDSSELILSDDNFATIINAVEQGRIVFKNTRNTSFFLITSNVAEHVTLISTMVFGLPLPLLPTQILWLNLVTDTGQGLGLSAEPGQKDILAQPPHLAKEEVLNFSILPYLLIMVSLMAVLTFFSFKHFLPLGIEKARTGAFVVMSMTQIFNSLNMRCLKKSVFKIGFFKNKSLLIFMILSVLTLIALISIPFLQNLFGFSNIGIKGLITLFLISSLVFITGESYKFISNKINKKKKY